MVKHFVNLFTYKVHVHVDSSVVQGILYCYSWHVVVQVKYFCQSINLFSLRLVAWPAMEG